MNEMLHPRLCKVAAISSSSWVVRWQKLYLPWWRVSITEDQIITRVCRTKNVLFFVYSWSWRYYYQGIFVHDRLYVNSTWGRHSGDPLMLRAVKLCCCKEIEMNYRHIQSTGIFSILTKLLLNVGCFFRPLEFGCVRSFVPKNFSCSLGEVQQIPTPIMFLDNLNQNIKSWRNPKFHVKISFFATIMDILNFACGVISVPLQKIKITSYPILCSEMSSLLLANWDFLSPEVQLQASSHNGYYIYTVL